MITLFALISDWSTHKITPLTVEFKRKVVKNVGENLIKRKKILK